MRFLSREWAQAVGAAAAGSPDVAAAAADLRLSIRHVVTDTPDGPVTFTVRIDHGHVVTLLDDRGDADVVFTEDYATAAAIHRGEVSPQEALGSNRLTVHGETEALTRYAAVLAALGLALSPLRERTSY